MGHGALEKYRNVNNCALMFGLLSQDPARPHSGFFRPPFWLPQNHQDNFCSKSAHVALKLMRNIPF